MRIFTVSSSNMGSRVNVEAIGSLSAISSTSECSSAFTPPEAEGDHRGSWRKRAAASATAAGQPSVAASSSATSASAACSPRSTAISVGASWRSGSPTRRASTLTAMSANEPRSLPLRIARQPGGRSAITSASVVPASREVVQVVDEQRDAVGAPGEHADEPVQGVGRIGDRHDVGVIAEPGSAQGSYELRDEAVEVGASRDPDADRDALPVGDQLLGEGRLAGTARCLDEHEPRGSHPVEQLDPHHHRLAHRKEGYVLQREGSPPHAAVHEPPRDEERSAAEQQQSNRA